MDSYGTVRETICGLPVMGASGQLLHADFWGEDQPLFLAGLAVTRRDTERLCRHTDDAFRPKEHRS